MDDNQKMGGHFVRLLRVFICVFMLYFVSSTSVKAENKIINYVLIFEGNQRFENLIKQAESVVIDLLTQEFTDTQNNGEVSIIITGDRYGQQVPLISTKVSRLDWQKEPKIQSWSKYFSNSAVLLGLHNYRANTQRIVNLNAKFNIEDDPGFRDD